MFTLAPIVANFSSSLSPSPILPAMRDRPTSDAIAWSWRRLAALVAGLAAILSATPGWLSRVGYLMACRQVRLAEGLARRLLICRVGALCLVPAPVRYGSSRLLAARLRAPRRMRVALGDRLAEFYPAESAPGRAAAEVADWVATGALARRVAGLQALLAAPDHYARLMARRLAGLARRAAAHRSRTSLLRPGRPPGLPGDPHDLDGSALWLAHDGALGVLNTPP